VALGGGFSLLIGYVATRSLWHWAISVAMAPMWILLGTGTVAAARNSYESELADEIRMSSLNAKREASAGRRTKRYRDEFLDWPAILAVALQRRYPGMWKIPESTRRQQNALTTRAFRGGVGSGNWRAVRQLPQEILRVAESIEMSREEKRRALNPLLLLVFLDYVDQVDVLGGALFKIARSETRDLRMAMEKVIGALVVIGDDEFSREWMLGATQRVLYRSNQNAGSLAAIMPLDFGVSDLVNQLTLLRQ